MWDLSVSISAFLVNNSITIISYRLCLRVLSVCIGKTHNNLQSSYPKTFFGLSMYHFFYTLLIPIFHLAFHVSIWERCYVSLVCISVLVLGILTQYVHLFHKQHHMHGRWIEHFLHRPHFLFSLNRGPALVLLK